ncbi:hypothetical protein B9Z55_027905 [Caenorhabditis nigoni]|uniref:Uncharacterized protein n=1 Tax=Caenorhabditis nigoni TaxID=1611254 RepID=A0A2G5SDY5_9PELO|nr:hypothetical protein B9Z55_027905 [Caenorhabditis nigoni]
MISCVCNKKDLKEFHPDSCQNLSENVQARRPFPGPRPRQGALKRVIFHENVKARRPLLGPRPCQGALERVFWSVDLHCLSDQEKPESSILPLGCMKLDLRPMEMMS